MSTWTQVRDAIQAALVTASGLGAGHVIWKFQNVNQPTVDYIALSLGGALVVGRDDTIPSTDLLRSPGQEIRIDVIGMREVSLEIECFTATVADSSDALARADLVRTGFMLPSVRAALSAAGVVPFDPGPVQYVPEVVNAGFRGRSTLSVRCYLPAQAVFEYTGYVASIAGSLVIGGGVPDPQTIALAEP